VRGLFPGAVIERRRGDCVGISGLMLCLGERLGLPLRGVLARGHFFVRYEADGLVRNIETLRRGIERDDEFYRKWFGAARGGAAAGFQEPAPEAREGPCAATSERAAYMRSLETRGALAVFVFNCAGAYRDAGRTREAEALFLKATSLLPGFPQAHLNVGVLRCRRGEIGPALRSFRRALELDPALEQAHRNLSLVYRELGEEGLALRHERLYERARAARRAREAERPRLLAPGDAVR
jgi:tetratricopeptide (TPR) repeat protein